MNFAVRRSARGAIAVSMVIIGPSPALAAPIDGSSAWRPAVGRAMKYAERREGSVTFAVVAPSGRIYRHRARTRVPAASVLKVMFMTAYLRYRSVRVRPLRRADKDLLRPMIRRSDNDSATRIAERLGPAPMNRLARRAGMKDFSYTRPWGLSTINARDQARFMNELERYIPKRHERYAWWLLSHIVKPQRWGVAKATPPGWRLSSRADGAREPAASATKWRSSSVRAGESPLKLRPSSARATRTRNEPCGGSQRASCAGYEGKRPPFWAAAVVPNSPRSPMGA